MRNFTIIRIFNIIFITVVFMTSCKSLDYETTYFRFANETVSCKLPSHHILKKELYEEGVIYYVNLKEGCLVITEGANILFPTDRYKPQATSKGKYKFQYGLNDNSYWRKGSIGYVRVYGMTYKIDDCDIKLVNKVCNSVKTRRRKE